MCPTFSVSLSCLFILPIASIQSSDLLMCLFFIASFISPEKGRKMLPTPVGTASGTSLLGPSLLDGNSRDSFVSRSLADVAEVCHQTTFSCLLPFLMHCYCTLSIIPLKILKDVLTSALQLSKAGVRS